MCGQIDRLLGVKGLLFWLVPKRWCARFPVPEFVLRYSHRLGIMVNTYASIDGDRVEEVFNDASVPFECLKFV